MIHRLVLSAFVPNTENKEQVNHINGIKSDNRLENLEWCTNGENQIHAISIGLKIPHNGEKIGTSKLKEYQVLEIRASTESSRKLGAKYGVNQKMILNIKNRVAWKNL